MTRTYFLRWTAAATLLVGVVALGTVVSEQAGRILNLFSSDSAAPPSADLSSDASNQDRGLRTAAYSGRNNFAQHASRDAGILSPAAPSSRFIGTPESRSDNVRQTLLADSEAVGPATGLRASGDPTGGTGFAAPSTSTSSSTSTIGGSALTGAAANFAQLGPWGWATSGFFSAGGVGAYPASTPASSTPATFTPAIPATTPAAVAAVGPSTPAAVIATGTTAPASAATSSPVNAGEPAIIAAAPIPPVATATSFIQTEGKTVVNDELVRDSVDILGGRLGGSGTIQSASVTIGAGAILGPGNSPGVLTINGNLLQLGELEIEIAGKSTVPVEYDVLHVTGDVTFAPGSLLKFVLYPSYSPSSGDAFEFLTANSISGIDNLAFAIAGLPSDFGYQVYEETQNGESDLYVRFSSQAQATASPQADEQIVYVGTAVPEPSTMALAVLGLALLGWRLRRRAA